MIRNGSEMEVEVREHMRGGAGSVTIRHLFKQDEFTADIRLCAYATLAPGAGIGPHQHTAEDEVYVITRGSGVLTEGETQCRVSAGDAILTGNGGTHAIHNDGNEPLELLAFIVCYPRQATP